MGQALKVIKFNPDEQLEENQNSSNKKKSSKFPAGVLPLGIAAIFTAILGVVSLVLEVKIYFQFRYEIYLARLFPTIFSLITLLTLQTNFGIKNRKALTHSFLFSILASLSFVVYKLPSLFIYNILAASLFILVLSLFLSWNKINQMITVFYFSLLFGTSAYLSNLFNANASNSIVYFSTSISILLVSVLGIALKEKSSIIPVPLKNDSVKNESKEEESSVFKDLVEESVVPLFRIKINGELCFANNPFLELISYSNTENLSEINFFESIIKNEKVKNHFLKKIENKGQVENYRFTYRNKDASEEVLLLDCRSRLLDDEVYIEGSLRNITNQYRKYRLIKNELESLRNNKRQSTNILPSINNNAVKPNVLSRMGHELRTPMNSVLGFLTLIENGLFENEEELKEFSHSAKLSAESLLALLNDVVEISKTQDGSAEVIKDEFFLRKEIEKIIETLKPHFDQKELKLKYEIDENIPEKIIIDQQKYLLIIENLLRNAINLTDEGVIEFYIQATKNKKGLPQIVSTIKDSSSGFTDEEFENVFNYDFKSSEQKNITSSILFIMIAKEFANIIDGNLEASSELGEGSKYTLTLDLESKLEENKEDTETVKETKNDELLPKVDSGSKPRLLLVEDNPISRKVEQKLLQEAGYDVTCVESGADAIVHVEQGSYNVVLMDIELKDMDGLEATKLIRQLPDPIKNIPIIAVTAQSSMKDREKCLLSGMNDYISKPINITFLKMTIDQWLQQANMN